MLALRVIVGSARVNSVLLLAWLFQERSPFRHRRRACPIQAEWGTSRTGEVELVSNDGTKPWDGYLNQRRLG